MWEDANDRSMTSKTEAKFDLLICKETRSETSIELKKAWMVFFQSFYACGSTIDPK